MAKSDKISDDVVEPETPAAGAIAPAKQGAAAKRKVYKLAKGRAVDMPVAVPGVPDGYLTTQDHEQRITALEIAAGIKKIEVTEVDDAKTK